MAKQESMESYNWQSVDRSGKHGDTFISIDRHGDMRHGRIFVRTVCISAAFYRWNVHRAHDTMADTHQRKTEKELIKNEDLKSNSNARDDFGNNVHKLRFGTSTMAVTDPTHRANPRRQSRPRTVHNGRTGDKLLAENHRVIRQFDAIVLLLFEKKKWLNFELLLNSLTNCLSNTSTTSSVHHKTIHPCRHCHIQRMHRACRGCDTTRRRGKNRDGRNYQCLSPTTREFYSDKKSKLKIRQT